MRIGSSLAALAVTGVLALAGTARAQAPDLRAIRPIVMLLIDTSGSMEYRTDYVQTGASVGCSATGACPDCSTPPGDARQRSRWSTVLEALTGSWTSYSCTMQGSMTGGRTGAFFTGQYDYLYPIPYFQPPNTPQNLNGVLDAYVDRVKFGLMTFDGAGTLVPSAIPDASGLVDATTFSTAAFLSRSNGWEGMYSYGLNRPVLFPGCPSVKMINNGARSATAPAGALISVGTDVQDYRAINQAIQTSLLATRSYGGTPIAGMLDDLRQYFTTNTDVTPATGSSGDPYYQCRQRYALLLTDGYPDSDFRGAPFYCEAAGATASTTCHNAVGTAVPCQCPYDTDTNIAADLCRLDPMNHCDGTGAIDGLFVVGLAIDPTTHTTAAHLDTLATLGGTAHAYNGTDLTTLRAALSAALDTAASTVNTRTAPAFANTGGNASTTQAQYQFNTGFVVGSTVTTSGTPISTPWSGVIERRRFVCDSTLTPVAQALDDGQGDRFQNVLTARSAARNLYTILPAAVGNATGWLTGASTSTPLVGALPFTPAESGLTLVPFTRANPTLTRTYFGVTTDARRDAIIDYVQGAAPAERAAAKLGDVYHSSPVIVGSPPQDVSDESFNYFRQRSEVATRPTVMYVGTNDGILHAFATGTWTYASGPHAGTSLGAGDELWGFVPPAVLSKLDAAASGHQLTVDGTPVVREVFYRKTPGAPADGSNYHTVLVVGLRGSNAYEAIDVTDPLSPQFLWQYADTNMGLTYAQPGVGQVLLRTSGGGLEERGIAVLPGGTGGINLAAAAAAGLSGCPAGGAGAAPSTGGTSTSRTNLRCWNSGGREVTVMDIATGERIAQFDATRLNAPMTGSVSLFTGDTGTIATRAYMTDQDGVIWRLDMGTPSVGSWALQPFHDIFWDAAHPVDGQPGYNPPILSVDNTGKVIVLQGTGDIDALDGAGANRVVSLTETQTCPTPSTCTWSAGVNWEVRLAASEQVTGPMELYNGVVYFGSFQSIVDPLNACSLGASRVWGLKYIESQGASGQPTPSGKAAMETTPGSGSFAQYIIPPTPLDSVPVMGVGVTQQPTCFQGSTSTDPYFGGSRYQVTSTGGGQFTLVAQFSGVQAATSVSVMTRQLPAPASYTSISSWTSTTD